MYLCIIAVHGEAIVHCIDGVHLAHHSLAGTFGSLLPFPPVSHVLHPFLFPSLEKLVKASGCLYSSSLADLESKCKCLWGGWGARVLGDEGL